MTSSHLGPPQALDTDLELDPQDWERRQLYFLMTGLVVPRPIAWVSTLGPDGVRNVAPHSYFNMVSANPPHLVFSTTGVKDTVRNIRATGEFVVNLVTSHVVEEMNFTATNFPPDEDEFTWAGLESAPSVRVGAPRVAAAKGHLECGLVDIVEVGDGNVVIGEVVHIHVASDVWRDGRVDPKLLSPVLRLAGTAYGELGEVYKLARPVWDDVRHTRPGEAIPRR